MYEPTLSLDPPCWWSGDHNYRGSSKCSGCGHRLRCGCGQFVREDDFDRHLPVCRANECPQKPLPCDGECKGCLQHYYIHYIEEAPVGAST